MSRTQWRKPGLRSSLFFIGLIVVFVSAARWQWQRAEYKIARAAEFAATLSEPAHRGVSDALAAPDASAGERVRFSGVLDISKLLLLDNQVRDGKFGIEVYAPFVDAEGAHVLVGLGWIASDPSRQQAPILPTIPAQIEGDGLLTDAPAGGLRLGASAPTRAAEFPLLLTRIEPPALRDVLALPMLADRVLLLPPDPASGFARAWHLTGLSADKHRGYALQWISFAIGTLVFFVLWHRPRKGNSR